MRQIINRRRYVREVEEVVENHIITYRASAKLTETTSTYSSGLHVDRFFDESVSRLTVVSHTFSGNRGIIVFSDDVAYIGDYAFYYCDGLTSVTYGNSVKSIGEHAFQYCSNLTSVTAFDNVTFIGPYAFSGCSKLKPITIPNGVQYIADYAFGGCSKTSSINIPSSVIILGKNPFSGCFLESITIDSGNTAYDTRNNCKAIIETSTNKLITGCWDTVIPSTVTSIGDSAFGELYFANNTITIPDSVTSIGNSAFSWSNLNSITIPNNVTRIGDSAFSNCTNLTSVSIGQSVTSIGEKAFEHCRLISVTIPYRVSTLGSYAFNACQFLETITCVPRQAPSISRDTFYGVKTGGTLRVPSSSSGYNAWMSTDNYYLGTRGWTMVTY